MPGASDPLSKNKAVRLKDQAERFSKFLAWVRWCPPIHRYASAVRNTYNAVQEAPEWTLSATPYRVLLVESRRLVKTYLKRVPHFDSAAGCVLLAVHPIIDDSIIDALRWPTARVRFERSESRKNILINAVNFIVPKMTFMLMLICPWLNRRAVFACLSDLLDYTLVINRIDLGETKVIVTHRDRYGAEVGIMRRARAAGVPTVKIDYYSPLDAFCQNTVEAEYYFFPNENNRGVYMRYPHNRYVKCVSGGLPKWDLISNHVYNPQADPKIILFMGQYDIEAFTGVDDRFYLKKILEFLPEGFQLYIKPHPSEQAERYQEFVSQGARMIAHGEIDNYELIAKSTICLSVYSAMLYEAKHLCARSYVINYFPELAPHVEYDFLSQYADHIKSDEMLKDVLGGRHSPIPVKDFIGRFNHTYPRTRAALGAFVKTLKKN